MEFVDPPAKAIQERSDKWTNIVWELKHNRDKWALVGEYSPGVATQIRRGDYKAFLDPDSPLPPASQMKAHWEVTTRNLGSDGRRNSVYIRYVG